VLYHLPFPYHRVVEASLGNTHTDRQKDRGGGGNARFAPGLEPSDACATPSTSASRGSPTANLAASPASAGCNAASVMCTRPRQRLLSVTSRCVALTADTVPATTVPTSSSAAGRPFFRPLSASSPAWRLPAPAASCTRQPAAAVSYCRIAAWHVSRASLLAPYSPRGGVNTHGGLGSISNEINHRISLRGIHVLARHRPPR
jgi:hypothetical protein